MMKPNRHLFISMNNPERLHRDQAWLNIQPLVKNTYTKLLNECEVLNVRNLVGHLVREHYISVPLRVFLTAKVVIQISVVLLMAIPNQMRKMILFTTK